MNHSIPFDVLPVPALVIRAGIIIAVNPAYLRFTGFDSAHIIGRRDAEFAAEVFVPEEHLHLETLVAARTQGLASSGDVWVGLRVPAGQKSVRVSWTTLDRGDVLVSLYDLGDDGRTKVVADALGRAAGLLVKCSTETEVLARSAEALFARGLSVVILLIQDDDPVLTVGPVLGFGDHLRVVESARLPVQRLHEQNPGFSLRRAIFLDAVRVVDQPMSDADRAFAGSPVVQAPLFVDDEPYGAIVAMGDALTPGMAGAVEMFTELVARALEGTRRRAELAMRVDELRQLQAERVERERLAALGEAAGVMAHEVRNPVAAMLNAVALLRKETTPPGNRDAALEIIYEEAHRLNRIVHDLIDLGRPLVPRARSIVAVELVERGVRLLDKRGDLGSVNVVVDGDRSLCVFVDPDLLGLAVENVLRNAVQACGLTGTVKATIVAEGQRVLLLVDDSGPGIGEPLRGRVFEPFFTTRATGTGLGLAVVRRAVEANAGRVETGVSPLGGARLRIDLPAAEA